MNKFPDHAVAHIEPEVRQFQNQATDSKSTLQDTPPPPLTMLTAATTRSRRSIE
jgi:hypothetical protein